MVIQKATGADLPELRERDRWISSRELERKIARGEVYVLREGEAFVGWLRYGLFWDNTPFLYMLHIAEGSRGRGYGTRAMEYWEEDMRRLGYGLVMTSSASTETAQHFYYKRGYRAAGSFMPADEPLELLFIKKF